LSAEQLAGPCTLEFIIVLISSEISSTRYLHVHIYLYTCVCISSPNLCYIQVKEILQEEEDLSEIVQLVGKVMLNCDWHTFVV